MNDSCKALKRNNFFYEYLLKNKILEVKGKISDEELVKRIMSLAKFSWRNHTGYFFDGRIENVLYDFGKNLSNQIDNKSAENSIRNFSIKKYTTVHVATELGAVGGHTRILYQFLKRYQDSRQIVILTSQSVDKIPEWFTDDVDNLTILSLVSITSLFERAYLLRYISKFSERVILYHHPYDAVPIMAFSHDECPPVLLDNHSHSWFWLGSSIADVVLAHSSFHRDFTLKTRPVANVHLWPFTQLDDLDPEFSRIDKSTAKKKLNIDLDSICLITIGTEEKFIPNAEYNFYKTAKKIIDRFENVEIFVIGISESLSLRKKHDIHTEKIHLLGPLNDPSDYYKAADICLDALPQPSLGGTMYSALIGLACPLFKYGNPNIFSHVSFGQDQLYDQYVGTVIDEREYLEKLEFLINNAEARLEIAEDLRKTFLKLYSKEQLTKHIKEMLDLTNNLKHVPNKIPNGQYFCDADSAEIADTSSLQDLYSVINYFDEYLTVRDKIKLLFHLTAEFPCTRDVLILAWTFFKNRIKHLTALPAEA